MIFSKRKMCFRKNHTSSTARNYASLLKKNISYVDVTNLVGEYDLASTNRLITDVSLGADEYIPNKIIIDTKFAFILGCYLAEGSISRNCVQISCKNEGFAKQILRKYPKWVKNKVSYNGLGIIFSSKNLVGIIQKLCGKLAENKNIPPQIFSASRAAKRAFLNGYFSGDGWVEPSGIYSISKGKQITEGVIRLLAEFGIYCQKKEKVVMYKGEKRKYYVVFVPAHQAKLFLRIGFSVDHKIQKLNALLRDYHKQYLDMVPLSNDDRRKTNVYKPTLGRNKLLEKISVLNDHQTQLLANADAIWDVVVSIQPIANQGGYVYDLSVPAAENFIVDGIVVHNSKILEWSRDFLWGYFMDSSSKRSSIEGTGKGYQFSPGLLQKADNSVLFIDEIDKLTSDEQTTLLRAMESGKVDVNKDRVSRPTNARIRVVATSNNKNRLIEPLLSRFDIQIDIKQLEKEEIERLITKRFNDWNRPKTALNDDFLLKRYLMYAAQFEVKLPEDRESVALYTKNQLNWGQLQNKDIRQIESIPRLLISLAKLKLKRSPSEEDLKEIISLIQVM